MKKTRYAEMQIFRILETVEAGSLVKGVFREYGISDVAHYSRKQRRMEWKPPISDD